MSTGPAQYADAHRAEFLDLLCRLVTQPSVSAQGLGVPECAELLASMMRELGIKATVLPTSGFPVVFGSAPGPEDALTVLIYGHYDVQPPEPYDAWFSPPFEPTVRDGRLYGRGAADNKGQLLAHVLAVGSYLATGTPLPVNVKFLFEGEEESGSPNLEEFVAQNLGLLRCDLVVTSDGPMHDTGRPIVFFGVRGSLYVELIARGACRDLHSGHYGGIAPNPAFELCRLIATMKRPDGKVAVEGFYENVVAPTAYERELMSRIPLDEEALKEDLGVGRLASVGDLSHYERLMFEPTLNVCGLAAGYQGPGSKTIIPARASAKIDMRLVANQDPKDILDKVIRHVRRHSPDVEVVQRGWATAPSKTSPSLPLSIEVVEAVRRASPAEPVVYPSLGASMPDYIFTRVLGVPSIGVPLGNPDEHNHSPNENFRLEEFYRGIGTSLAIISRLGAAAS